MSWHVSRHFFLYRGFGYRMPAGQGLAWSASIEYKPAEKRDQKAAHKMCLSLMILRYMTGWHGEGNSKGISYHAVYWLQRVGFPWASAGCVCCNSTTLNTRVMSMFTAQKHATKQESEFSTVWLNSKCMQCIVVNCNSNGPRLRGVGNHKGWHKCPVLPKQSHENQQRKDGEERASVLSHGVQTRVDWTHVVSLQDNCTTTIPLVHPLVEGTWEKEFFGISLLIHTHTHTPINSTQI